MINLLNKTNMKKLIYLTAITGSLLLTTSCVDLTQEPESFITEEQYWTAIDQASLQKAADALYSDLWQGNYGFNSRLQQKKKPKHSKRF